MERSVLFVLIDSNFFLLQQTTANNDFQTFIMVSKTEYQPWYGSECITPREINEQWMDTYLRPESKIFCGTHSFTN